MKIKLPIKNGKKYTFHRTKFVRLWNQFHPENSIESEEDLRNEEVYRWLEGYIEDEKTPLANETKRSYLNALKQIIKENVDDSVKLRFDQKISTLSKKIIEVENNNRLNPVEDNYWMEWAEVLSILKGLEALTKEEESSVKKLGKREKSRQWSPKRHRLWQQRLLLSLYVNQPVPLRHNYSHVLFMPANIPDSESKINYIFENPDKGEWIFHLGNDKVIQSHGPLDIPIEPENRQIIEIMLALFGPRKFLLTSDRDLEKPLEACEAQPVKHNTIRLLSSIPHPQKEWKPSHLGLFTLRSAKATHFLNEPNRSENEVAEFARRMRTSVLMLRSYYKKIPFSENENGLRPVLKMPPIDLLT